MRASNKVDPRPLIAHVVYRFDTGGLENGVINLVNRMSADAYRHAIVALTEVTDFRRRVERSDVAFVAIGKRPGHGVRMFPALFRAFRQLAPAIVHTRNLAALEATAPAWAAGAPVRLHGEHGREVTDLDGTNRVYRGVRKAYRPFVTHYVTLSGELTRYLEEAIHIDPERITQICNGVDTTRFTSAAAGRSPIHDCPFTDPNHWLVGTVGRLDAVKDQPTLVRAFARMVGMNAAAAGRARLVIVGDGPLRADCERLTDQLGLRNLVWYAGERRDIPAILRGLDCFVLPSRGEGISNTILEAMASGLPIVATNVGGSPELVDDGISGWLVPAQDDAAMASAILDYFADPIRALGHGKAGRDAAIRRFGIDKMVLEYQTLYDRLLAARRVLRGHGSLRAKPDVGASLHETR
jgi:sugar transferase (PEP-CTERM/EpsH1 system associated)